MPSLVPTDFHPLLLTPYYHIRKLSTVCRAFNAASNKVRIPVDITPCYSRKDTSEMLNFLIARRQPISELAIDQSYPEHLDWDKLTRLNLRHLRRADLANLWNPKRSWQENRARGMLLQAIVEQAANRMRTLGMNADRTTLSIAPTNEQHYPSLHKISKLKHLSELTLIFEPNSNMTEKEIKKALRERKPPAPIPTIFPNLQKLRIHFRSQTYDFKKRSGSE